MCVCVYKFCSTTLWILIYSLKELLSSSFFFCNTHNNNNKKRTKLKHHTWKLNSNKHFGTHTQSISHKKMLSNYSLPTASFKTSKKKKKETAPTKHPNPVWCGLWSAQSHEKFMYGKNTTTTTTKKKKLNLWTEIQNPQTPNCKIYTEHKQSIILNWILMFVVAVVAMKIKWKQFV